MNTDTDTPRPDPLIDEIRAIRKEISDRFDNDVTRLIEYLRQREKEHPERLVTPERREHPR